MDRIAGQLARLSDRRRASSPDCFGEFADMEQQDEITSHEAECERLKGLLSEWQEHAAAIDQSLNAQLRKCRTALRSAEQFITNGVEMGYIRMPDHGDAACATLPLIQAALAKPRPAQLMKDKST